MRTPRAAGSGGSSLDLVPPGEPEPDTADGMDVARRGRIVAEVRPQRADVHVEGLRRAEPIRVPDLVDQALSGDDGAGVLHQETKEVELLAAELQLPAVERRGATVGVEPDLADDERAFGAALARLGCA